METILIPIYTENWFEENKRFANWMVANKRIKLHSTITSNCVSKTSRKIQFNTMQCRSCKFLKSWLRVQFIQFISMLSFVSIAQAIANFFYTFFFSFHSNDGLFFFLLSFSSFYIFISFNRLNHRYTIQNTSNTHTHTHTTYTKFITKMQLAKQKLFTNACIQ